MRRVRGRTRAFAHGPRLAPYARTVRSPRLLPSRAEVPGLAIATGLGLVAIALARMLRPSPFASEVLLALVLGAVVRNTRLAALLGIGGARSRFAPGLTYTAKTILRVGIVALGLNVQTSFFGGGEIALIVVVALTAVPSAFFVAHALGSACGLKRPLVDLLAGGTMICGASAVNAIAPIARAHEDEQAVAIGVVFLFSIVALVIFHPVAVAVGLGPATAGLWSGLAVNDLSSAIAVGAQMGDGGAAMAAAAKSARIVMLAPTLVALALLRNRGRRAEDRADRITLAPTMAASFPTFILGYGVLAIVRAVGDHALVGEAGWMAVISLNKLVIDVTMAAVSAGIGLSLAWRSIASSGARAIAVGGGTSLYMAGVTLAMIAAASRGARTTTAVIAVGALGVSFAAYRMQTSRGRSHFVRGSSAT